MHHKYRKRRGKLTAEISVRNAVERVLCYLCKAEKLAHSLSVYRVGRTCERTASQRHSVHSFTGISEPPQITQEHISVSHKVVRKGDGLCSLKVSIAGHYRKGMLLCDVGDCLCELFEQGDDLRRFVLQRHSYIKGDLVVPRSCGVQALARVTEPCGKLSLDKHMYILGVGVKRELSAFDVLKYALEALDDSFAFALFNDTALAEHRCVSYRAGDVLPVHSRIEFYRRVEVVDPLVRFFCKSSCPHLL